MDIEKLNKVVDEILKCDKCSFHQQLKKWDIPYRPDAPLGYELYSEDCKVIAIGINPGWVDKSYTLWKEIYAEQDIQIYKTKFTAKWEEFKKNNQIGRQPYRDGIYYTFEKINAELGIYEEKIGKDRIFDYVFWSNLSFCSSQNVWQRKFDGKEISCNVLNEEIPNCLSNGYLNKIIEAIEPKLIMFFGYEAINFFHFTKIFDIKRWDVIVNYPKTQFPAHKRGDKSVQATIIACKLKANDKVMSVLFLPHPNYRFNSEYKAKALKEVCDWLKIEETDTF